MFLVVIDEGDGPHIEKHAALSDLDVERLAATGHTVIAVPSSERAMVYELGEWLEIT